MSAITVIIAAYNAGETLGETLRSVLDQTLRADEVMVVDDGSSDNTWAIAVAFPGVLVERRQNGGPAAAWNWGLGRTSGETVAFLDADDLWPSTSLADHQRIMDLTDADGSVGQVEEFISTNLSTEAAARLAPRSRYQGWLAGAMAVRRRLFETVGPFSESLRVGAWIDWIDRARNTGARFETHPGLSLRRRLRPGTLGGASTARDADLLEVARRAIERRRGDR